MAFHYSPILNKRWLKMYFENETMWEQELIQHELPQVVGTLGLYKYYILKDAIYTYDYLLREHFENQIKKFLGDNFIPNEKTAAYLFFSITTLLSLITIYISVKIVRCKVRQLRQKCKDLNNHKNHKRCRCEQ